MGTETKCKASVLKSNTLVECSNTGTTPHGICGPIIGKIPVVIAEPIIQVDVEAEIELEEPFIEIKRIKKNVFITQCRLVDIGSNEAGKLFLSGFVRKNIEYATADCTCGRKSSTISGDIKHTTVNIPFNCVTKVHFVTPPQVCYQENPREAALFTDKIKGKGFCGQRIIGSNPCEMNFQHHECFNEKVFCELEEVRIFEDDLLKESKCFDCDDPFGTQFEAIVEKMVVFIRLKLLQLQQVNIRG
ncbi:MAG: hypothetical protein N2645_21995 [Clostridia bacterium]|nr:hypothetical protein [Clostridia bacterium]